MKNYIIQQTKGKNLRQVVSSLLVRSPTTAVKELVSNGWDADAEIIRVQIIGDKNQISVEDNGTGMDEKGLESFLSMGDSEKLQNPLTQKGRRKIGRFGIANTLLQFLGEGYRIQTWNEGTYIEGFEEFKPNPTGGMDCKVYANPEGKHGTSILIDRSRFVGAPSLRLDRLEVALAWELPEPRPDFKVILNDIEVKRIIPEPIEEIEYHDDVRTVGDVHIKISLYDQPVKIHGLYVYVDQRAVGNPEIFQLRKALRVSPNRVLITVDADGLRDSIIFNRERMIEDERFQEFRKYLHRKLYTLARDTRPSRRKAVTPSRSLIADALGKTNYSKKVPETVLGPITNSADQQNMPRSTDASLGLSNMQTPLTNRILGFRTYSRGTNDAPATYNPTTGQISFNENHPLIKSKEVTNPELLKMHILLATCIGIAQESYSNQEGSSNFTDRFNNLLAKVLDTNLLDSVMIARDSNETGRFAPSRDYLMGDLIDQGLVTRVALPVLIRAGIFNPREDKISGREINNYFVKSVNHTPAVDLVWYEWGKDQVESKRLTSQRLHQLVQVIDERLTYFAPYLGFIYNIGVTNPFFLVENESTPLFLGLLAQDVFKGESGVDYKDIIDDDRLKKIRDIVGDPKKTKFASLDDLCGIVRGRPYEVMQIVGYSQRHGWSLPTNREGDRVLYSVSHFKEARLRYLEVNHE